jgi:hypothetical protein
MVRRWLRRLFGATDADLDERRRIAAEHDRHRTDAMATVDRVKYGRQVGYAGRRDLGPAEERRQP